MPRAGPLQEPLDEPRRQRRRDDGELERARGGAGFVREDRRQRRHPVRLDRREDLEARTPVAVAGVDALCVRDARALTSRTARRPRRTWALRIEPAAPDLELEARVRRRRRDPRALRVEQDGRLVARRVLELLDHQLPALRGRGPVHPPQRLALCVLAHAVEVEAARPPHEQPPSLELRARPTPRRAGRARRAAGRRGSRSPLGSATAARSSPNGSSTTRRVPSTGSGHVEAPGAVPAAKLAARPAGATASTLAEAADPLGEHDRPGRQAAVERRARASAARRRPRRARAARTRAGAASGAGQPHPDAPRARPRARARPRPGRAPASRGAHAARRRTTPSASTERPRRGQHRGSRPGRASARRTSRTTSSASTPDERASGARISRCASTAAATAFTSSGSEVVAPLERARAPSRREAARSPRAGWRRGRGASRSASGAARRRRSG